MTLIEMATQERKRQLVSQERLERVTGAGGSATYEPGERWRNNKQYLADDSVTDSNGKLYYALQDCRNKPPANNPDYWQLAETSITYTAWSSYPVGTVFYGAGEAEPQSHVFHNGKNWDCSETHVKTAGNAPRQGSTVWIPA